ncbi:MAG: hypothetical protein K9J16_13960 [Melioribacteraceae bacterium]|nr:hypothetical protein [Melioribacteraceae bacterium]MCF8355573.1 hypothetical protein [Melioribacteraceae bacterium]MCF8395048.1 hypothetical protein [Melioribacteraceae bacterium]MCF8420502.1 hypothetical protein [Melioribacteraceae bacterium]
MKNFLKEIPEQVTRIVFLLIVFIAAFLFIRSNLVPEDFGKTGHYRFSAIDEIISVDIKYAGQDVCNECHDDIVVVKDSSYHHNVTCEVCHGAAAIHADDPVEFTPTAPRERNICPQCHEYLPSRPTGFPQIISASHNPLKPCITCHNPHDPVPPETPKECSACHKEISSTKSISHHALIPCTKCHSVPEKHRLDPREYLPTKPGSREFCGQCHSEDADSEPGIPRIDLETHETKYVCWQCHYPHLPEAK